MANARRLGLVGLLALGLAGCGGTATSEATKEVATEGRPDVNVLGIGTRSQSSPQRTINQTPEKKYTEWIRWKNGTNLACEVRHVTRLTITYEHNGVLWQRLRREVKGFYNPNPPTPREKTYDEWIKLKTGRYIECDVISATKKKIIYGIDGEIYEIRKSMYQGYYNPY